MSCWQELTSRDPRLQGVPRLRSELKEGIEKWILFRRCQRIFANFGNKVCKSSCWHSCFQVSENIREIEISDKNSSTFIDSLSIRRFFCIARAEDRCDLIGEREQERVHAGAVGEALQACTGTNILSHKLSSLSRQSRHNQGSRIQIRIAYSWLNDERLVLIKQNNLLWP